MLDDEVKAALDAFADFDDLTIWDYVAAEGLLGDVRAEAMRAGCCCTDAPATVRDRRRALALWYGQRVMRDAYDFLAGVRAHVRSFAEK